MGELWRVIPKNGDRPADHIWTTRESLDQTRISWHEMMLDKRQPASMRIAATRLWLGTIQVAASIVWDDSE